MCTDLIFEKKNSLYRSHPSRACYSCCLQGGLFSTYHGWPNTTRMKKHINANSENIN